MNHETLVERLNRPEWSDAEFKEARAAVPKSAYEAVSAFANTGGGTIVFGVRDRGGEIEVVGVDQVDKVQNEFLSTIRSGQKLSRQIEVEADAIEVGGRTLLAFFIPESARSRKPVYLDGNPRRTFVRRGGCNERCRRTELGRLLRDAAEDRYDSRIVDRLDADKFFDARSVRWYRSVFSDRNTGRHQDLTDVEFLHERGFVVECGDRLAPTRAGILVFGQPRYVQQVLPRPVIDLQFIGATAREWSPDRRWTDRFVVEENLLRAWLVLSERYARHAESPFSLDMQTMRRNDHPPDFVSFREAAINQLIHQDYGDHGRTAFIRIYRDRTVFWNPGDAQASTAELLDPTTKEVRNPAIVSAFRRIGLSEQAGTGMRAIFRNWRSLGNVPPVIRNDKARHTFEIALLRDELLNEEQRLFQARLGVRLDESQAALLALARREGRLSVTDAKAVTGRMGPEARELLNALVVQGLLLPPETGDAYRLADHLRGTGGALAGGQSERRSSEASGEQQVATDSEAGTETGSARGGEVGADAESDHGDQASARHRGRLRCPPQLGGAHGARRRFAPFPLPQQAPETPPECGSRSDDQSRESESPEPEVRAHRGRGGAESEVGEAMTAPTRDGHSGELFVRELAEKYGSRPVTCLGITFESDEARREYFLDRLKERLPELRKRPDFPHGEDEDILRMSDPPYYTACPNPFLADFVEHHGRPYDPDEEYHREPYAVDVSVGKTDKLYRAHPYHTKVPHLAIVPSILHYTKPGDLVLDGFCGSGMTGVAAQWCGTAPESYRKELDTQWKKEGRKAPEWGARRVILGDLSPAATFIAANYNIPFDVDEFAEAARKLLDDVEDEVGWMYETLHTDGKTKGRINYTVWSEVFSCPECAGEVVFTKEALDMRTKRVRKELPCPHCAKTLTKRELDRRHATRIDPVTGYGFSEPGRVPVLIEYLYNGAKCEVPVDNWELRVLVRIDQLPWPLEIPHDRMMHVSSDTEVWGDAWRSGVASFTHVHHLFHNRSAQSLAAMWRQATDYRDRRTRGVLLFFVEQAILGMSMMNRYGPRHFSQVNRYMSGRVRILSQQAECNPWYILRGKLKRLQGAFNPLPSKVAAATITTGDCGALELPANSVDYIFTDPPFGDNLAYSELNFFHEAFHRVFTNRPAEAIVSKTQRKNIFEYQRLMTRCFAEYRRVLKPGRWMTIVFHNSKNAVWNGIQEALLVAGFVVADVRVLDKKQGTFNQVLAQGSVKKDLVISAYKPDHALEEGFRLRQGGEEGAWGFVRGHLRQLPVFVARNGLAETVLERQRDLLYDRMVAFHVQRGVTVPLSAAEFHVGLFHRFAERDDMYFLPEQVAAYDRQRMMAGDLHQPDLFVHDEETAIRWLRRELRRKPQSFQDIHPSFIRELAGWGRNEKVLELTELLRQNFLLYDGNGDVPSQIHSYLSSNFKHLRNLANDDPVLRDKATERWYVPDPRKAGDLEKLRERTLLREFDHYRESRNPLKRLRSEAIRAGFRRAWQERDHGTIVSVGCRLPESVLHNDPKLLMWYDQAVTRVGASK